jgi:hypothetical protein
MSSWMNALSNMGNYGGQSPSMLPGIGSILSGLTGNSSAPYEAAQSQYQNLYNQGREAQNPFYNMGTGAIPQYQAYNQRMSDPTQFVNSLMNSYQSSPYSNFMQRQAQRANTNAASAAGLIGSTPYQQAGEQYAHDIAGQDLNNWLNTVLGINTQYGQNLNNMMNYGSNAANTLSNMSANFAGPMGESAYGQEKGDNFDWGNILAGGLSLFL